MMIHFIIGEDNKVMHRKIEDSIHKVMFNGQMSYHIDSFFDYDKTFINKINEVLPNKIYILDIETPSNSGIEMARKIRETDIDSIIIFLTSYKDKYKEIILENEFMFFAFVSKRDAYEKILHDKITSALQVLSKKRCIRFLDCGVLYTIPIKHILYITTDTIERKTLIITDYTTFKISKTMKEIETMIGPSFIQTHKSCFVNKERIITINMREGFLYFDNHLKINLLSRRFKKEIKEEILAT